MAETINEADTIDMDHPDAWKPEKSTAFQGCTQREAYHGLTDGLDASQWAFKKTERANRLRPEAYIAQRVLPVFDEYIALYRPDDWDSYPAATHAELIEWRKREAMMAYRWQAEKAKCKKRGSWMYFGWLLVLLLLITSINEIYSAARQRELGFEWGARITERMKADNHGDLARQVDDYMEQRW